MARSDDQYRDELSRLAESPELYPIRSGHRNVMLPYPIKDTATLHPPELTRVVTGVDSGVLIQLLRYYVTLLNTLTAADRWVTSPDIIDAVRAEADICVLELRYRESHRPESVPATVTPLQT
jgi:hypothetical protein